MRWLRKRADRITLQKKNRLDVRLEKKVQPNFYKVDCDVEFKGNKISTIIFKTQGHSRRAVAKSINNDIKVKVFHISKIKK